MKTAFLLQNNHVIFNTIPVSQYGWKHDIEVIDRSSSEEFDADDTGIDWSEYDIVIPYGSVQFIRKLRESSLERYLFFSKGHFDTHLWIDYFGDDALNHHGFKVPAYVVSQIMRHNVDREFHVRPNSKDKAFTATVFDYNAWQVALREQNIPLDLDCFISPRANDIYAEYRCWVVDNKVVEISQYMADGKYQAARIDKTTGRSVWKAAQRLTNVFSPEPCVVIDIAFTDSGYKLIEFNSIHSSGWYAGDVKTILDALIKYLKN